MLDQRNYIYSLQFFFDEDCYNKKLRISCSSIIVFALIRQLPYKINGEVKKNYDEFINLLKNSMAEHGVDQKQFVDVYEKVSSLHEHGSKEKKAGEVGNRGTKGLSGLIRSHFNQIEDVFYWIYLSIPRQWMPKNVFIAVDKVNLPC